jgi:hypothetical protein
VVEGTADGFYAWLEQHPVTVAEPLIDVVGEAMTRWLDDNRQEIVAAIAEPHQRLARSQVLEEEAGDA